MNKLELYKMSSSTRATGDPIPGDSPKERLC